MNSYINHSSCSYSAKISLLIQLNFGCCALKLVKKNLNAYNQIIRGSLLMLYFEIFVKKEELRLNILYYICMKKTI